jgi:hypothetical protein
MVNAAGDRAVTKVHSVLVYQLGASFSGSLILAIKHTFGQTRVLASGSVFEMLLHPIHLFPGTWDTLTLLANIACPNPIGVDVTYSYPAEH